MSSSLVFAEQVLPAGSNQSVSESATLSNSTNCVQIADGPELSIQSEVSPMSPGTVTVYGFWAFAEEDELNVRPAKNTKVELWDSDLGGLINTLLDTTYTDLQGNYEFAPVDNNDGPFEDGFDIYVKIFTEGDVVWVSDAGGSVYCASTSCVSNVPDGRYNMSAWAVIGDASRAMAIYDTMLLGYRYAKYSVGYSHGRVHAVWPSGGTGTDTLSPLTIYIAGWSRLTIR